MGIIKDVRSVTLPDGNLAWRDTRSILKTVQTGKFTRNCVLTGKSSPISEFPLYLRTPGVVSKIGYLSPEDFGYFEASEGYPQNAYPRHMALTYNTNYWNATQLGAWLAYHHVLRPTMIRGYRFVTENGYTPRVWRVEGSNDNVTWTTLHSVTVDWTWDAGKNVYEGTVPTENRDYFTHHRLIIDEFDADTVRIYELQFWDSACPSTADLYLDADAENPLQLDFMDGYNEDGTPKSIIKTLSSAANISLDSLFASISELPTTDTHTAILFAEYDTNNDTVVFTCEDYSNEVKPIPISDDITVLSKTSYFENPQNVFDDDPATYASVSWTSGVSGNAVYQPAYQFWTHRLFLKATVSSGYYIKIYISEDEGATFNLVLDARSSLVDAIVSLDRPYYVTRIKIEMNSMKSYRYTKLYYLRFDDPTKAHLRKVENGKFYEWNDLMQQWEQKHKIPMGYLTIHRNPDNTSWEVASFVPNHLPTFMIAPCYRKVSSYLAPEL